MGEFIDEICSQRFRAIGCHSAFGPAQSLLPLVRLLMSNGRLPVHLDQRNAAETVYQGSLDSGHFQVMRFARRIEAPGSNPGPPTKFLNPNSGEACLLD